METQVAQEPELFYRSMLEDAIRFCRIQSDSCLKLSGEYRGDDLTSAHNQFARFLDQILTFLKFVDELTEFAKLQLEGRVDEKEFLSSLQELSRVIQSAAKAQSSEDWVLLADLLEYEFPQIFQIVVDAIDGQWAAIEEQDQRNVN
jgi:hypothetical protein